MRGRAGVYLGASLSAMNAWLILRGIDTLYPRMRQIHETAQNIAAFLEGHPAVKRVIYPGLASHPQADLARAQMAIAGGVITFQTADPQAMARQLSERLKVAHYAFSLGHQRSIVVLLDTAEMMASSYQLEGAQFEDYRNYAGEGVFRLSVGLEDCADLRADLDQALGM
jgi:methionine-gamma-lyase